MNLIGSINITSTSSSGSVQNIPQTYNHLYIVGTSRQDNASTGGSILLRFNNDSANNYEYRSIEVQYQYQSAWVQNVNSTADSFCWVAVGAAANSGTNVFAPMSVIVGGYARTNIYKPVMGWSGVLPTSSTNYLCDYAYSQWNSTSAINRVDVFSGSGSFIAGTKFDIYGI